MTFRNMLKEGCAYKIKDGEKLKLSDISDCNMNADWEYINADSVTVVNCTSTGCGYDKTEADGLCLYCGTAHSSHEYDTTTPTGKCTACRIRCHHRKRNGQSNKCLFRVPDSVR